MHAIVRRILEGTVVVLALALIAATVFILVQDRDGQPPAAAPANSTSGPTVASLTPVDVDRACRPWVDFDSEQFLCLDTRVSPAALWRGTLQNGITEQVLTDSRLDAGIWDAAWTDNSEYVLMILRGEDEPEGEQSAGWPVLRLELTNASLNEFGQAAPGATLQRRPDGSIAYPTQEAVTVYADGERHSVQVGPNASVYPHTLDTIRLSPTDETIAARLIVAQSGGALRLVNSAEQREMLIDRTLYRGERTFDWAPNGQQLAYANHDQRARQPSLWRYTLESEGSIQLWEAPSNGRIDFVTWLPDSPAVLFAFIPARSTSSVDTRYYAVTVGQRDTVQLWENGYGLQLAAGADAAVFQREFVDGEEVDGAGIWVARLER